LVDVLGAGIEGSGEKFGLGDVTPWHFHILIGEFSSLAGKGGSPSSTSGRRSGDPGKLSGNSTASGAGPNVGEFHGLEGNVGKSSGNISGSIYGELAMLLGRDISSGLSSGVLDNRG
jgi:hypothetical protein